MGVKFDEATHTYSLDGKTLPSVTTVIDWSLRGKEDEFEPNPWYRDRGIAVHKAIALLREDDLHEGIDPAIRMFVAAYQRFCSDMDFVHTKAEIVLASARHGYAGTVDALGILNGVPTLIDWKTGDLQRRASLQTAAYAEICRENGLAVVDRMAVQLKEDGTYKAVKYEGPKYANDFNSFKGALDFYVWAHAFKRTKKLPPAPAPDPVLSTLVPAFPEDL